MQQIRSCAGHGFTAQGEVSPSAGMSGRHLYIDQCIPVTIGNGNFYLLTTPLFPYHNANYTHLGEYMD